MDIICVDANVVVDKKPDKPTYDPMGKLWNVSHHYKHNTTKTDKIQNLEVGIRLSMAPTLITTEDAHITCDPLSSELKQDIVFNNGKFVDFFVLPEGRHYFKCFGDDIEYMGQEFAEEKVKLAKCQSCTKTTISHAGLPFWKEDEYEHLGMDEWYCGCRGYS